MQATRSRKLMLAHTIHIRRSPCQISLRLKRLSAYYYYYYIQEYLMMSFFNAEVGGLGLIRRRTPKMSGPGLTLLILDYCIHCGEIDVPHPTTV